MAFTKNDRFKNFDNITYDLENEEQKDAYDEAVIGLQGMTCTLCGEGGSYREYKAYGISSPMFPLKNKFGYGNLKDGSIIYCVDSQDVYMFTSLSGVDGGEWVLQ